MCVRHYLELNSIDCDKSRRNSSSVDQQLERRGGPRFDPRQEGRVFNNLRVERKIYIKYYYSTIQPPRVFVEWNFFPFFSFSSPFSLRSMKTFNPQCAAHAAAAARPLLLPSELWRAYNPGVEAAAGWLAGWLGTDRRRHKSSCIEKKEQKEKRRYEAGAI